MKSIILILCVMTGLCACNFFDSVSPTTDNEQTTDEDEPALQL